MEVKRGSNRASVFGSFDDSEDEDDGDGERHGGLFGKAPSPPIRGGGVVIGLAPHASAPVAQDPAPALVVAPPLVAPPPIPASAPTPAQIPVCSPPPSPLSAPSPTSKNRDLAKAVELSVKVLGMYLQDEGAGAPREVWEALEKIKDVGKRLQEMQEV